LRRDARVYVLDKLLPSDSYLHFAGIADEIHFVNADIRDAANLKLLFARYQFDTVFHTAAQPIVSISNALPLETAETNITGTFNVLEACRLVKEPPRLVFASSGAYYGATSTSAAIPEEATPLPSGNIYAASKVAGDIAARTYAKTYGLRTACCRWMNTYGPGDTNFSRIVPATLRRFLRGERALLDGTDGSNVLELLHVRDMAEAYLTVAENLDKADVVGEAFNFGSGEPLTLHRAVLNLAKIWNELTYPHEQVIAEPIITGPHSDSVKFLDIRKAHSRLGWMPRTTLDDGLRETAHWYREHRDLFV
jgi:nucleoside-diphosphate-sugar epimerase